MSEAQFTQTHWTTLLQAQGASTSSAEALNRLCLKYWPPVYAFIRRQWKQHSPQEAEDLTQEFFVHLIKRFPYLELSASKGKFRTYLLACLNRFLCKDWERSPRSREIIIPPEEIADVLANRHSDPVDCAPDRAFDRAWADLLTGKAIEALREEYVRGGKAVLHDRLLPLLTTRSPDGAYSAIAADFQMSEGALRVAVHEFRRRFGELLRTEVAGTVSRLEDTDEELRYLLSLWAVQPETQGAGKDQGREAPVK